MGEKRGEWERLSSRIAHQNAYYHIREDTVVKPDGSKGTYHVLHKSGAVGIVPMDDEHNIYLIGLHRYTTNEYSLEIPYGGDDGENSLVAAKRELQEETGLTAGIWHKLGTVYPMNGISDEPNFVYLATGLQPAKDDKTQEEGITKVAKYPYKEVLRMIKDNEITDAQTITAVTLAALHLGLL